MASPTLTGEPPLASTVQSLLEAFEHRCAANSAWLTFHRDEARETFSGHGALAAARAWSHGLRAAGVLPGERVGIWQPNCASFVASFFGALGAGAIPVPLAWPVIDANCAASLAEAGPLLKHAGVTCIAAPPQAHVPGYRWVTPTIACDDWPHRPRSDDTAFLQFTSGSTGHPRGAVISHAAALANAAALVKALRLTQSDVGVSWIPFFHDMGLIGVVLTSLLGGFSVHVMRPSEFLLRPWRWLELVGEFKATLTVAPDFGYAMAARRSARRHFSLSSLRCALTGSEPIQLSTLDAFDARFEGEGFDPLAWVGAYGLAENTLGVTVGPPRELRGTDVRGRRIPSVGLPLAGTEVSIREGEVCVRSPSLARGYFEDAATSAKTFVDGWLHTGDLGVIEQGRLFITGREKDLVVKAGTKFHPGELEQAVAALLEAPANGVVAFNDADQLVVVVEQRAERADSDVALVRNALVAKFGVRVDRVTWVPLGSLPRTTSGKLRRSACAEKFGATL